MKPAVHTGDLFEPALTGYRRPPYRPWRLHPQVYVAFFGGPLAIGAIAVGNAVKLGMTRTAQLVIAAAALLAEAALVAVFAVTDTDAGGFGFGVIAGLAAYGPAYLLQRSPDRVYLFHSRDDEPYDGLLGPGLVAVVLARIAESALLG
jgi:hypothetical protein